MSRVTVFAGPTVQHSTLLAVWGSAVEVRPPARAGDLVRAATFGATTLVLIDGHFHGCASVWHAEVVELLSLGIRVIGCASLGAIRASELDVHGMIGFGHVYRWYKRRHLVGDDEVAVMHSPATDTDECRPLSVALVNLRHALAFQVRSRELQASIARDVISSLKSLPFYERTAARVSDLLGNKGVSIKVRDSIIELATAEGKTLKWKDAMSCLKCVMVGTPNDGQRMQLQSTKRVQHSTSVYVDLQLLRLQTPIASCGERNSRNHLAGLLKFAAEWIADGPIANTGTDVHCLTQASSLAVETGLLLPVAFARLRRAVKVLQWSNRERHLRGRNWENTNARLRAILPSPSPWWPLEVYSPDATIVVVGTAFAFLAKIGFVSDLPTCLRSLTQLSEYIAQEPAACFEQLSKGLSVTPAGFGYAWDAAEESCAATVVEYATRVSCDG